MYLIVIMLFCFIIFNLLVSKIIADECPADKQKDWSYEDDFSNGPPDWSDKYSGCKGKSQSPINIDTRRLSRASYAQNLKLKGYGTPIGRVKIENNGHTINITPRDGAKRLLELDNVEYNLDSLHFHWGKRTSKGSEHEINGKTYTMEAHLVHRNDRGEIVVVGVLFEESSGINQALENILYVRNSYRYEGESYEGAIKRDNSQPHGKGKIYLEDLVDERCSYYRYNGSLTTPPCTENVTWLLCKAQKNVKRTQMSKLFALFSVTKGTGNENKCHLIENYRPIQPLNGRNVYT